MQLLNLRLSEFAALLRRRPTGKHPDHPLHGLPLPPPTIVWWMPCCAASCAVVSSPRSASRALNSAEYRASFQGEQSGSPGPNFRDILTRRQAACAGRQPARRRLACRRIFLFPSVLALDGRCGNAEGRGGKPSGNDRGQGQPLLATGKGTAGKGKDMVNSRLVPESPVRVEVAPRSRALLVATRTHRTPRTPRTPARR